MRENYITNQEVHALLLHFYMYKKSYRKARIPLGIPDVRLKMKHNFLKSHFEARHIETLCIWCLGFQERLAIRIDMLGVSRSLASNSIGFYLLEREELKHDEQTIGHSSAQTYLAFHITIIKVLPIFSLMR